MNRDRLVELWRAFEERELTRGEQIELLVALSTEMVVSKGLGETVKQLRKSLERQATPHKEVKG